MDIVELIAKWKRIFEWDEYIDSPVMEATIALKMELAALYIISLPYHESDQQIKTRAEETVETCIFPVIFRVIKGGGSINNIPDFYRELIDFMNLHRDDIMEFINHPHIDIEAEMCALFVERYLEKNIDPITPKKFIKKWGK
jgi:GTP1/Obg family GTP-binding protein